MATATEVANFINKIAPLIQKYAKQYGYKVASPIIAQACCESAFGTSSLSKKYYNYFGMKCGSSWRGKSVNLETKEEYKIGTLTDIKANFRAYNSMEEGIKGYFEFISKARYANLKTATTPQKYLELIKEDGYATSSTYVKTNMNIITKYGLIKYDNFNNFIAIETAFYPAYLGKSSKIDEVLKEIGVPDKYIGNKFVRLSIAKANYIQNYTGTAEQNLKLIALAKSGKLRKVD